MFKVRVLFEKKPPACYISHLDLMKALQRALRRADLPVRYSEGFNPHIVLSILVPLSTGYSSRYDLFDFELTSDDMPNDLLPRLNAALPSGLFAVKAGQAVRPVSQVASCRFEIVWKDVACAQQAEALLRTPLTVEKKSKRGSRIVSLGDYIYEAVFSQQGENTVCSCTLKAGDDPLNPHYLTDVLVHSGVLPADIAVQYTRCAILDETGKEFF